MRSNEQYLTVGSRIGWRLIGDEVVVFNCATQQIVIWDEIASRIWLKAMSGVGVGGLIGWLVKEFALTEEAAIRDLQGFMEEAKLICAEDQDEIHQAERSFVLWEKGENVLLAIEMEAIKNLIPFATTFEVTDVCNEQCIHCYMERGGAPLSLKEIERILGELAAEGCLFLSLTGGEFFARKDAIDIVELAGNLHYVIDILSNGTLLNEREIAVLAGQSVRRVQVSLYGDNSETHDSVTRLAGSFDRTIDAIKQLKTAGLKVEVAFPMMKQSFSERYGVRDLVESLDCLLSPSPIITARNNGRKDTYQFRLGNDQLFDFLSDKEMSALYAGRRAFQDHQFYLDLFDLLEAAPCYSGFNSCAINPQGKVMPCNQLLYEVGDLRNWSFAEIWRESPELKRLRSLKIKDLRVCANCQLFPFCARCPGLALLEGGDLLAPSPENCRIAGVSRSLLENIGKEVKHNEQI